MYHNTFDNNEEQLVAALQEGVKKAAKQITPMDLNGTVRLLKELGHEEVAKGLIPEYISARKDEPKLFELVGSPFGGEIDDPDVRAAFAEQVQRLVEKPDPAEILLHIAKNSSWNPKDIEFLSKLGPDDFYTIFKSAGENASRLIGASLTLSRLNEPMYKAIGANVLQALRKIGSESRLNRRRVSRYGIDISDEQPPGRGQPPQQAA